MALVTTVEATAIYTCRLSEEDEQKIRDYIGDTDLSTADAIRELHYAGEINLYKNSTESGFYTNCIIGIYRKDE